ncbi:MAG TPA: tRNA lysidine(34) synthetase TilS [Caulobacteraceae bacterium]|nr:tRNA lysidine(34) synthetase TilS [Caulobacteraceae bacterium]
MAAAPPLGDEAFGRLNAVDARPVAVAVSGGGDSLALLLMAADWSARAGRPLIVLTLDHRLAPAGARWAGFVGERARRLGLPHRTLVWDRARPATGLPAAARAARHGLLAEAARAAGARVILMGHTADDLAEVQVMRLWGASLPSPREWSPSPIWPQGRGVFLLRPLLAIRRAALRDWLSSLGERWIEDPANEDAAYARARARRRLAGGGEAAAAAAPAPPAFLADLREGPGGELVAPRAAFSHADDAAARRWLAALVLSASGTARPPRGPALQRLLERMRAPGGFVSSLAGARIEAGAGEALFCREPGELRRCGPSAAPLAQGESVFDGRFSIVASAPGSLIAPLAGQSRRLAAAARARLRAVAAPARPGLPAITTADGRTRCPVVEPGPTGISAAPLAGQRLLAALGAIADEAAIGRVAKRAAGA